MQFEKSQLTGDKEDVLSSLIEHITRSEEKAEAEEESGSRRTELKVFVAENQGFEVGSLNDILANLIEQGDLDKRIETFIAEHNFHERVIGEDASYIEIDTPKVGRTDQFVFFDDDDYLRVITAERRSWTKKTVERLITYLPTLERVYLSPSDLEEIVDDLDGTSISGFTAKHHTYDTEKRVSIRFHGGEKEDLNKVEKYFDARPTRLEFDQTNSPSAAVQSSVAQEGHFSFSWIRPGSQEKGLETLTDLSHRFAEHDKNNYRVDFEPVSERVGSGFVIDGCTTLELTEEEEANGADAAELLEEKILDYKQRYKYSCWQKGKYEVFDTEHNEPLEITIEDGKIALHAKEGTSASSLRDFCNLILETFSSTYSLNKTSRRLRA
jgi:hypothetical protein